MKHYALVWKYFIPIPRSVYDRLPHSRRYWGKVQPRPKGTR